MSGGTGSYLYMAPEVFRYEPYNVKADIYSLAMVIYEMLAGHRPFEHLAPPHAAGSVSLRITNDEGRTHSIAAPFHYTLLQNDAQVEVAAVRPRRATAGASCAEKERVA